MSIPDNIPSSQLFLNRELSLLEFQRRVLDEALDERNPLLDGTYVRSNPSSDDKAVDVQEWLMQHAEAGKGLASLLR